MVDMNYIFEGGNAVSNVSRINRLNVEATVDDFYKKVLPLFKISKNDTVLLGSAGKKETSGDLDVGFNYYACKCNNADQFIDIAKDIAKQLDVECTPSYGLKEASYRWPIANIDGKQEGQFVQIDLMPSKNINYLKWGMNVKDDDYKGAVRNVLLCNIAGYVDMKVVEKELIDGQEIPVIIDRYVLSTTEGLFRKQKSIKGKKSGQIIKTAKTLESKFITNDVKKIVHLLFGDSATIDDLATATSVWESFKKTKLFKNINIRKAICEKTIARLKKTNTKYPKFLDDYNI